MIVRLQSLLSLVLLAFISSSSSESTRSERIFNQLRLMRSCAHRALNEPLENATGMCDWAFDGWTCWEPVTVGTAARAPCTALLPGPHHTAGAATYRCVADGTWDEGGADYVGCTSAADIDPELEVLQWIVREIGDFIPWEVGSSRGENILWEEKIGDFKICLADVILKPFPQHDNGSYCPRTWDGWSCWDDTPAGSTTYAPCPRFVAGFASHRMAHKVCNPDGTWFRHPTTKHVWSNYTACVDTLDLEFRNVVNFLYVGGYFLSLVALLISLFIFFYFRSLRCRRITIHKNLFSSFIMNNLCWILWYIYVIAQSQVIEENPVWCQVLHVLTQYFLVCNYLWMFCEGLYLHTLLVMAFITEEKILKWFLMIGWGFPLFPIIGYAVARGLDTELSKMCWLEHDVWYTYILSVPVCLSILLSFAFLVNIVRVLVTKLRAVNSPDNESTRKAVRATVILLPLLGLHYVVTPFRPEKGTIFLAYEIISALVTSLQGLCVSLLFCFFNGEVLAALRKCLSQTPCFGSDGRRLSYANTSISVSCLKKFMPRQKANGRSPSVSPNHVQQTLL
ncbi:calcitonin gene-related peptide type 1 receptor-like isoform X2 [Ornithodoros turicata]|uniref:calcitonin gene-related peptide type 1 receptor-like isoform X2 n=1 Tax=Ornithodoros turicata TaxID=34597 RepID=UPI00313A29A7